MRALLGEGARKRVYLARDVRLERDVALALIKTEGLDEAGLDRVRREAQEMARLGDHPHIVTIHDIGEADGRPYIVSQYMAGGDVKGLLEHASQHRLPVEQAVRIAEHVCRALEHAHARGVIHRDLKPDNVWLMADGTAKLGDFGLAIAPGRSRLTAEGVVVGTFAYMAPEQALGRSPDARSDLYALGAMLYEILTGRPPFVGDDPVAIVSQHINTAPVAPSWHNPQVPKGVEALILKLLAKVPDDRPEGATAVRESLASAVSSQPRGEPSVSTHNPLGRLAGGVFVGREAEMEEMRAVFGGALLGRGRLVLLGGEPGVGKTSIAQELATYARMRGLQVLWGRCHESGGAPAYWPWVEIIRSYVHDCAPGDLASAMGSGAADIAQVVAEVGERLPGLPARPSIEAEEARFRLFDSVTTFLRNAGKRQALVLIFDDLHAADKPSLLLLQFLARQVADTNLLVVALYRDVEVGRQHPLFQILGELVREPVTRRLSLRGLRDHDVARYVEMTAGFSPSPGLVDAVFRETEGNPFFVGEIVRLLAAEGALDGPEAWTTKRFAIPQGVREAIGRRLDRLSAECNRALGLAAVIGREFAVPILERVSGLPRDRVLAVLEEAVASRVVGEVPRAPGHYAFVHGLFRETLYEELTTTSRVQIHRRVGEALEALYRVELEPHLAEVAYHFFEATQGGDVDKAIAYCVRAGDRATSLMAHEEAVRHYELALQALELTGASEAGKLVDLLLTLGEALWRAGEIERAKEVSQRSVEVARGLGASDQLARAALGVAGWLPVFGAIDGNPTVIALLKEALAALAPDDSPVRARVMARLAEELTLDEAHEERWALSRGAIDMARRLGDDAVLASVLRCAYVAVWDPEKPEERVAVARELIEVAERIAERTLALEGRIFRLIGFVELGDAPAVRKELDICERQAKELRRAHHQWLVTTLRGCLAFMEGRLNDIQELTQRALSIAERAQQSHAPLFSGVQLGHLMWLQGRFDEVEPWLIATVAMYPMVAFPARVGLGSNYSEQGREHEARAQFESLAANDFANLPRNVSWQEDIAFLSEACAYLGDSERAAQLYALLLPFDGRNLILPPTLSLGASSYFLGLLAATMGRREQAAQHFEAALTMNARMGTGQWLARTQTAYAEMLLNGADPGDRSKAADLLDGAVALAGGMSMPRLLERASALKSRASDGVDMSPTRAEQESDREKTDGDRGSSAGVVPGRAAFRREGEYWTIAYEGAIVRLKDTKGLRYVAHLLRHPGQEFHALDLMFAIGERPGAAEPQMSARHVEGDVRRSVRDDTGFVLDPTAKAQYRRRLDALREEEQEAERFNDPARAAKAREEIEAISQELDSEKFCRAVPVGYAAILKG